MHDPEVQVFDVSVPIPRRMRWREGRGPRWTFGRRRFTNVENLGEPVYAWWRPQAWSPVIAGRHYGWRTLATVWHVEPGGHDSGTICKGLRGSHPSWSNFRWAWAHRRHLHVQVPLYQRVCRWRRDRCAGCGRRFFWKDSRYGYMSSDEVFHDVCMSLRVVRAQLEDITAYVECTADWTTRWRVEYRLKGIREKAAKATG